MTTPLRAVLAAATLGLIVRAAPADAQQFSTANVQVLQGYDYDNVYAPSVPAEDRTTLTFNHFATFANGDSFFFADLTRNNDDVTDAYAEWHPRIFLNKLLGQEKPLLGVFKNYGAAFEVNTGHGNYAYLAGAGVDFNVPFQLSLNVFYRYDSAADHQWQISPSWGVPFKVGPVPLVFAGFVDVNGTKNLKGEQDLEVWAQPQLLLDVGGLVAKKPGKLFVGSEWYYHKLGDETVSVPQAMVQWTIF